jgi:hypothetical protein
MPFLRAKGRNMRAWIIGVVGALTFATTAHANCTSGGGCKSMPRTAGEWIKECPIRDPNVLGWCYAFMIGLHEGLAFWNEHAHSSFTYGGCPPVEATNEQLFEVTMKYIRSHPEVWHELASKAILAAWWEAWPCKNPLK